MFKLKNMVTSALFFVMGAFSFSALADTSSTTNGVDLSTLTNSINFNGVLTAIMSIAGALIGLYAGYVGIRWVLRMVKGA